MSKARFPKRVASLKGASGWAGAVSLLLAAIPVLAVGEARAESSRSWTAPSRWADVGSPKAGAAQAIGFYGSGCLQGAMALEPQGPGFEVLRRARRRFFGHPALVDYVRRLAAEARRAGLPALLVGDLAQPRGGPAPSGHGSHQSGLDVDLAYTRPPDSLWSPLDPERRETLEFPAVVDPVRGTPTELWHPRILRLLELAASDPVVDRIFVHPTVKREACAAAAGAPWVSRLRPWWGHHDHFHVRLRCPAESPRCIGQPPVPLGDGCGADLAWWFGEEARRRPLRARRPSASLPGICRSILGD